MGQVLHGSATTTEAIRRAIQHSQESLRALAKRYGINPKTVAKWKKRTSVADLPTGPRGDCQEFRVWAAIMDPMEVPDGTTQSSPHP
jgi:transposase-like protein